MYSYEEFINFYRPSNIINCAKNDVRNYITTGVFWAWLISVIAFIIFSTGLFIRTGWLSLFFILSGLPFMISWAIYIVSEPRASLFRHQVNEYLETKYTQPDWAEFLNYVTVQYDLEDSRPIWSTGYGIAWLSLAVGQLISYILEGNKQLNLAITAIMIQSAVAIIGLLYFIDNVLPRRKTRIHFAIIEIRKFQKLKNPSLA